MADPGQHQTQGSVVHRIHEKAPEARQVGKVLGAVAAGAGLLLLAGMTVTGTVMALLWATPVFLFLSPILVPVATVLFVTVAGLISAGGLCIAALSWIVNYMRGKHPPGSQKVDYARQRIASKARHVKERAKEYSHYIQNKAKEATQAS